MFRHLSTAAGAAVNKKVASSTTSSTTGTTTQLNGVIRANRRGGSSERALQRRLIERKIKVAAPEPDAAPVYVQPKHLGLGNDIGVNFALCEYGVAPEYSSFLSLPVHRLAARVSAPSTITATKAIVTKVQDDVPVLIVGRDISLENYRAISIMLRTEHLSTTRAIFAHDCSVGCTHHARFNLRIVSDDPSLAMFASHVFPRAPAASPPHTFAHPFSAFVGSNLVLSDPSQYSIKHSRLIIVNPTTGTTAFIGANPAQLADVYATLFSLRLLTPPPPPPAPAPPAPPAPGAAPAAPQTPPPPPPIPALDAVPLRSDAVEYGTGVALIVGATDAMRAGGLRRFLVGPTLNVWHEAGLSPVFAGATFADLDLKATQRNDLVLKGSKSHSVTTPCVNVSSETLADPKALVFIVNDAKLPLSATLSPSDAANHVISGYRGGDVFVGARATFGRDPHWARSQARIQALLTARKTRAIVVNVAGSKSVGDIEKLMIDVLTNAHSPKEADTSAYTSATKSKIDAFLKTLN